MSSNSCTDFRAHHLRPDKCRKCFGDKSKHLTFSTEESISTRILSNTDNNREEQLPAETTEQQQDNKTTMSSISISSSMTNELGKSSFELELKVNELNREQLIEELGRIFEERERYKSLLLERNQLVSIHEREIEQLKRELEKVKGAAKVAKGLGEQNELKIGNCETVAASAANNNNNFNYEELEKYKSKCRELEKERDLAREELKALEHEMEEMHDNFKEEESEQFEQVKQELDIALKNCKILQIRLNKAERQYSQLEQVKTMLERQLEDNLKQQPSTIIGADDDNNNDNSISNSASFIQCGTDFVKLSTTEYDQLLRDLNDTIERERDLQEQIKYSQEEAQFKGERLQAAEAENEVLLSKVNKLTMTNSKLRSTRTNSMENSDSIDNQSTAAATTTVGGNKQQQDMIEQNEQLKLALDLAQSECERLRANLRESHGNLEIKENTLKNIETKKVELEDELSRLKASYSKINNNDHDNNIDLLYKTNEQFSRLELECRQLRSKLVRSERECKQLKAQLDNSNNASVKQMMMTRSSPSSSFDHHAQQNRDDILQYKEQIKKLKEECEILKMQNNDLIKRNEMFETNKNVIGQTKMENDLLEKLKHQLNVSESELAKTKSRLVEINLEYSQLQRQYKRLMENLESSPSSSTSTALGGGGGIHTSVVDYNSTRKVKLPPETMRDSMSRQELRQAIKELEHEIAEWMGVVKSKDCLIKEFHSLSKQASLEENENNSNEDKQQQQSAANNDNEQKLKSLQRLFDQERSLSNSLRVDIKNLENQNMELKASNRMFERERAAMEEELDKLRQVNQELRASLEESKKNHRITATKLKDLQLNFEKFRNEYGQQKQSTGANNDEQQQQNPTSTTGSSSPSGDLLLMSRDLSELKVKNSFLMRQLEMSREDTSRQLDDLRQANAAQQRRSVELAQLELKERHLAESQALRDELNDLKQKLTLSQRQLTRSEEEVNSERDRLRTLERDWRRDKSQWLQRLEQLEGQLTIEKRSNEIKIKESESLLRYKDRELINVQDKCVQLERDLKRMQNKYNLLEENGESKQKQLTRELELKKRELSDLMTRNQSREDEYYDNCKRFNKEKTTLLEALESIKRTYDEKLIELKSVRELLLLRQDQSYKERQQAQDKIDQFSNELIKMSEHETQAKLLQHQNSIQEKQIESIKRELMQSKEDRMRFKTRNDELERRCQQYEKQELINKTTSIAQQTTANTINQSFLKGVVNKNPFSSFNNSTSNAKEASSLSSLTNKSRINNNLTKGEQAAADGDDDINNNKKSQCEMIEKLSSKINDQRHLINLIKQQHSEAQNEIKQLKLLLSSERNRWKIQLSQLTSRLNECEEKLLFESSQLLSKEMFDNCKKKIELKWNDERQTTVQLLQQQQNQNEILVKDLKKLNQSYELLRLQSKQLESQNNRLSRKLIEYQQSPVSFNADNNNNNNNNNYADANRKLNDCLRNKRELEDRQTQLEKLNRKLIKIMEDETKPLVETVSKIVAALDGDSNKQASVDSANSELQDRSNNNKLNSLHRPLLTSSSPVPSPSSLNLDLIKTAQPAHQVAQQQQSSNRSRLSRFLGSNKSQTTTTSDQQQDSAAKAYEDNCSKQTTKGVVKKVRVKSSTLGITPNEKKQLKKHLQELSAAIVEINREAKKIHSHNQQQDTKLLSNTEEQQSNRLIQDHYSFRASSEVVERPSKLDGNLPSYNNKDNNNNRNQRCVSYTPTRTSYSESTDNSPRVVHWGLDERQLNNNNNEQSDMDSEKSWSMNQLSSSSGNPNLRISADGGGSDSYRRFPQTTPASYFGTTNIGGSSLTDYDSETSLASECSTYSMGAYGRVGNKNSNLKGLTARANVIGGAESDSCMQTTSAGSGGRISFQKAPGSSSKKNKGSRGGGLKVRLTNTLRNISRSITSVGGQSGTSDTEDTNDNTNKGIRRPSSTTYRKNHNNDEHNNEDDDDDNGRRSDDRERQIIEIRV